MRIIELDGVDSTNEYIKRENFAEDVLVIAKEQTAGRGTKGRSFCSAEGGLYASFLHIYDNFPAENAFKIMVSACVAVCKTVEFLGIKPRIRWANDVLVGGKKICGTLIENTLSGGKITRSIVGVGLNVHNTLPDDLKDIAATLSEIKSGVSLSDVKNAFIAASAKNYTIADYKSYIDWFGKEVVIKEGGKCRTVTAVDVAEDGRLVVGYAGKLQKISAAEVSLKLI